MARAEAPLALKCKEKQGYLSVGGQRGLQGHLVSFAGLWWILGESWLSSVELQELLFGGWSELGFRMHGYRIQGV